MSDAYVVAERLSASYGEGALRVRVLSEASFEIARGSVTAILGASGSGKTTLLSLIGGLDHPDAGRLLVDGEDLASLSRSALGFQLFGSDHTIDRVRVIKFLRFAKLHVDLLQTSLHRFEPLVSRIFLGLDVVELLLIVGLSHDDQRRRADDLLLERLHYECLDAFGELVPIQLPLA